MPANTRPVTVGTTVVRALNYDAQRTSIILYNLGANTIYYGFNAETTAATGIPVGPSNAVVFAWASSDDPTVEYYLISAVAGNDVRIGEQWGLVPELKRTVV